MSLQPFGVSVRCACTSRFFVTGHRSSEPLPGYFAVHCPACGTLVEREVVGEVDPLSLGVRPSE